MMKKNRQMTNQMKGMFLLMLPLLLVSCGSFQGVSYYGDGIYGEELPVEIEVVRDEQPRTNPTHYKSYFNEMAEKANNAVTDYTSFTDVDSYQSATNRPSYAGWGQNTSRGNVTVNVYDNYYNRWGYDPYYDWNYGSNYYWGMGAWSPYYRSSWGYYGPRNRVSFGFGWSSGWNYPYYGYEPYYYGYNYYGYRPYYYGYRPYYYGYAYDPYYYGGGYYPYYGNTVYRNSNNYARVKGRRGGNMDYSSSKSTGGRSEYNNRSYSRGNSDVSPNRSYSRTSRGSYTPSNNSYSRETSPTYSRTTYERSNSSSSGSYNSGNSSSSSRSYNRTSTPSSGRTYSRSHRGG